MSEIWDKYLLELQKDPGIGENDGGEQDCGDGKGRFQDFKGGASIYYTPTTGAHLIKGLIRAKWIKLGRQKGPNGYPISDEGDTQNGTGKYTNFENGTIIWKRGAPEAFAVYGAIYGKWGTVQYDKGLLGFPLTDEGPTADNTGRFNDFEHGAIYYKAGTGTCIVLSPILEAWTDINREQGTMKFPKSDTVPLLADQKNYVQGFEEGVIHCKQSNSRSIVTSAIITPRVEPVSRSLTLAANPKYVEAWKVNDYDDTRTLPIMRLNRQMQFKTAVVIFPKSYTRTLTEEEVSGLNSVYTHATEEIFGYNFGLFRVFPSEIYVPHSELTKADFKNTPPPGGKPNVFYAEFNAYQKVIDNIQAIGFPVNDFDIVSICIPWKDTPTDNASGFAWSNYTVKFLLGNNKTWSTVHYIYPGSYWWAYFVHESTHIIEWMLEDYSYPQMRNNYDPWWGAAYPHLTSSTVVPPPENLKDESDPTDPTDRRLYAMHQRIKNAWFNQSWPWGQIKEKVPFPDQLLMYSCPEPGAIVETAWETKYTQH